MITSQAQKTESYIFWSDAFNAYSLQNDEALPCLRCGEIVKVDLDLNNNYRWFNLNGTNFCGPRGRMSHKVDMG